MSDKMPAGTYYIGDLCYVLNDRWDEVCDLVLADHICRDGIFTLKDGTCFAMFTTKYGDGQYFDQDGNSYTVDSGSIGCVMLMDISESERDLAKMQKLGNIMTFSDSLTVGSSRESVGHYWDGYINFDRLAIDTAGEHDYE